VFGAVGGFLGASKAAKQAAEEAKRAAEMEREAARIRREAREDLSEDFATRKAMLGASNQWEKERIRLDAAWAQEQRALLDLLNAGIITLDEYNSYWNITAEEHAAALKELTEQEKAAADAARDELAAALREVEAAAKAAAETTRQLVESLTERGYRLTGRGGMADTYALGARQRQEQLGAEGQPGEVIALMGFVHFMEREELKFNQAVGTIRDNLELTLAGLDAQATAAEKAWETEDAGWADQIELAEAALRVTQTKNSVRISPPTPNSSRGA
jgi:hypothetical protein